jgi:5'-phosphate synthase pdxT subunit
VNGVVGVLALQGAFAAHCERIRALDVECTQVRTTTDLDSVDALIMPGGESSTMSHLLVTSGLFTAISKRITDGMAVFGTCAGMILLASDILDGRDDQKSFAALDISVRRNAYGRQIDSFEADVTMTFGTFHGVFIRAPKIERVGDGVEILGTYEGEPVVVRQDNALAAAFHPELTDDSQLHRFFIENMMMKEQG